MIENFFGLHNLSPLRGRIKNRKRVGRGESSGWGKTAGRGTKGQKSRKSGNVRFGFEGGQTPISRRLPKRGFISHRKSTKTLNSDQIINKFPKYTNINKNILIMYKIINSSKVFKIKFILGNKKLYAIILTTHLISKHLKENIKKIGGIIKIK